LTGMWDKFYAMFERIDHKAITPEQLALYKEYVRLLGELLQASEAHMKFESKWLKRVHLNEPIPTLLVNLSEKLPESRQQIEEIVSELHYRIDHTDLPFQGENTRGHYTEAFVYWVRNSRSKLAPKGLRSKAKRFLELERDYDLWHLSKEEVKKFVEHKGLTEDVQS